MVKIRLTRTGKRGNPTYRVIAVDSRGPRDGKFLEILGTYNPKTQPASIELNKERIENWVKNGAQLSPTVRSLMAK